MVDPERVAQSHESAALMKKRKEEILHNKEQKEPMAFKDDHRNLQD